MLLHLGAMFADENVSQFVRPVVVAGDADKFGEGYAAVVAAVGFVPLLQRGRSLVQRPAILVRQL